MIHHLSQSVTVSQRLIGEHPACCVDSLSERKASFINTVWAKSGVYRETCGAFTIFLMPKGNPRCAIFDGWPALFIHPPSWAEWWINVNAGKCWMPTLSYNYWHSALVLDLYFMRGQIGWKNWLGKLSAYDMPFSKRVYEMQFYVDTLFSNNPCFWTVLTKWEFSIFDIQCEDCGYLNNQKEFCQLLRKNKPWYCIFSRCDIPD